MLVIFLFMAAFLTLLAATTPPKIIIEDTNRQVQVDEMVQEAKITPTPGLTPTVTLSQEFIENSRQTVGITLVGSLLVLIVVLGVLIFLPKNEQ